MTEWKIMPSFVTKWTFLLSIILLCNHILGLVYWRQNRFIHVLRIWEWSIQTSISRAKFSGSKCMYSLLNLEICIITSIFKCHCVYIVSPNLISHLVYGYVLFIYPYLCDSLLIVFPMRISPICDFILDYTLCVLLDHTLFYFFSVHLISDLFRCKTSHSCV